ncbi:hypothetical protein VNO77_33858 [Canavalia gladiata]|uniref:Uncharacterized protein n=1 Tax=Canavalia gladiata TaxID=3824 RepID=A0AAN9Q167_CANGL
MAFWPSYHGLINLQRGPIVAMEIASITTQLKGADPRPNKNPPVAAQFRMAQFVVGMVGCHAPRICRVQISSQLIPHVASLGTTSQTNACSDETWMLLKSSKCGRFFLAQLLMASLL